MTAQLELALGQTPTVSDVLMDIRPAEYKKPFMIIVKWGRTGSMIDTPHFNSRVQAETFRRTLLDGNNA